MTRAFLTIRLLGHGMEEDGTGGGGGNGTEVGHGMGG